MINDHAGRCDSAVGGDGHVTHVPIEGQTWTWLHDSYMWNALMHFHFTGSLVLNSGEGSPSCQTQLTLEGSPIQIQGQI